MWLMLTRCPHLLITSLSSSGWKLRSPLRPGAPQGRPLHPLLLHPAPEPGPGLRGEERRSVGQRGDQRHLQSGSVHAERAHGDAAVAAGWVSFYTQNTPVEGHKTMTQLVFLVIKKNPLTSPVSCV